MEGGKHLKGDTEWLLWLAWISLALLIMIFVIVIAIHQRDERKNDPGSVEAARGQISADLGKFEQLLKKISLDTAWLRAQWEKFTRGGP
jgi:hypothetical protein